MASDLEQSGELDPRIGDRDPATMEFKDRILSGTDVTPSSAHLEIVQTDGSVHGFIVPTVNLFSEFEDRNSTPDFDPELD